MQLEYFQSGYWLDCFEVRALYRQSHKIATHLSVLSEYARNLRSAEHSNGMSISPSATRLRSQCVE